jgi:hypothetical protein
MIIQHLKDFFNNKQNILPTITLITASSIATAVIQNSLTENTCKIEKPAYIFFKNTEIKQGILSSMNINQIVLKEPSENQDYIENSYLLDSIKKIVFFGDEESFKEDQESSSKNVINLNFIGTYKIIAGGHEGILTIYQTQSGSPGGYVRFPQWGKGKTEFLQYIQIKGNNIQFVRACVGKACQEIGSPYEFKQTYFGTLNEKGEIEGKYSGTHSSGQWKAIRLK